MQYLTVSCSSWSEFLDAMLKKTCCVTKQKFETFNGDRVHMLKHPIYFIKVIIKYIFSEDIATLHTYSLYQFLNSLFGC